MGDFVLTASAITTSSKRRRTQAASAGLIAGGAVAAGARVAVINNAGNRLPRKPFTGRRNGRDQIRPLDADTKPRPAPKKKPNGREIRGRVSKGPVCMKIVGVLLTTLALVACSGGGTAAPPASRPTHVWPNANVNMTITIPRKGTTAAKRIPQYISSGTQSAKIIVDGTTASEVNLLTGGPNCTTTGAGLACTISFSAAAGAHTFSVQLFSGALSGGHVSGGLLSASTFASTITAGIANVTLPLVLGGLPSRVDVMAPGLVADITNTVPLIVTAYDATNAIIIGPGAYVDANGATLPLTIGTKFTNPLVTLTNGTAGSSIAVTSPADSPTITLAAPADVLGIAFSVTLSGTAVAAYSTQTVVPAGGTLRAVVDGNTGAFTGSDFDDENQLDLTVASGLPAGAAFVIAGGTQSGTSAAGYYDASTHSMVACAYTAAGTIGYATAITTVTNGIVWGYATNSFPTTPPWGLLYLKPSDFSACPALPTRIIWNATGAPSGVGVPTSLVYDPLAQNVIGFTDNAQSTTPEIITQQFGGGSFSGTVQSVAPLPTGAAALVTAAAGNHYFFDSALAIPNISGTGGVSPNVLTPSPVLSLTAGSDGNLYYLRPFLSAYAVTKIDSTLGTDANFGSLTPANPSNGKRNLVYGPDGNVYVGSANGHIFQVSSSGPTIDFNVTTITGNTRPLNFLASARGYIYTLDAFNGYVYRIYK